MSDGNRSKHRTGESLDSKMEREGIPWDSKKYPILIDSDGEGGFFRTHPDGTREHYPSGDYTARVHRKANALREAMNNVPWFDYERVARDVVEFEDRQELYNYPK